MMKPTRLSAGCAHAAFLCAALATAGAAEFRDIGAELPPLINQTDFDADGVGASFLDFDQDGDLDLLMSGRTDFAGMTAPRVYRNEAGQYRLFADFPDLDAAVFPSADWADLDRDGRPELAIWVPASGDSGRLAMYSYESGAFRRKDFPVKLPALLTHVRLEFSDIDMDGYPDLLVSAYRTLKAGFFARSSFTRVLRNSAGAGLVDTLGIDIPVGEAVTAWHDIDADGDLDLFLSGSVEVVDSLGQQFVLPRSNRVLAYDRAGRRFTEHSAIGFGPYRVRSASMADYDGDGRGDLVISGEDMDSTAFFWNNGSRLVFDDLAFPIRHRAPPNSGLGTVAFGDADGDGDQDLLVTGQFWYGPEDRFSKLYVNDGGGYYAEGIDLKLPPYWNSHAFFVDFDKDGRQDIFLSGSTLGGQGQGQAVWRTQMYRNLGGGLGLAGILDTLSGSRARWADYDGDGDLDLVACGSEPARRCQLYRRQDSAFARVDAPFGPETGDPEWGDYDRDGDPDLLLAGALGGDSRLRLYRNTGGAFDEAELAVPAAVDSFGQGGYVSARFGDFDRDGSPDILAWGSRAAAEGASNPVCVSDVLLNRGGGRFEKAPGARLPGVCDGELEWGDYDRDGDLDVLLAGDTSYASDGNLTAVYRNDGGAFARTGDPFAELSYPRAAWGDFDSDGDLDFVLTGDDKRLGGSIQPVTRIYRLVGGRFEEFWKGYGVAGGDAVWLDYDNDGDLDLLTSGRNDTPKGGPAVFLSRNNGNVFASSEPFTDVPSKDFDNFGGRLDAADYDRDGDADFVAIGGSENYPYLPADRVRLYRNDMAVSNRPPASPAGLSSRLGLASAELSWGLASDPETPPSALRYNLRVGAAPGAVDVVSPDADPATGIRRLPGPGNAGAANSLRLTGLAPGTYYWSVQTVDNQDGASAFSAEQSFTVGLPAPRLLEAVPGPGTGKVSLRWTRLTQPHFRRYYLHYGTAADPVERKDTLDRPDDTAFVISGLDNGTAWHFRISAEDAGGNVSAYSNGLSAVPDGTPPAIPSGLSAVPGDRGIRLSWTPNTEGDFLCYLVYQRNASGPILKIDSIADAAAASRTVTGLKNGTPYSFLVVAVDRTLNYSGFSEEAVAIPAYLLTPSAPEVAFGRIPLADRREATLGIRNSSDLPVPVDSVRFVNPAFSLAGPLAAFPARAEAALTVAFDPDRPAGGDFTGLLRLYYGGSQNPLEIALSGSATAAPHCRIEKIVPSDIAWDTSTAITFLAGANDSDNAGEGDRITAYLWSSSLAGPLDGNASGFTLRPDRLGLGTHDIALRVVDNEGDTSLAAHAVLTIRGLKPLVRIESVSPAGLILRGADPVRIRCAAFDRDEHAGPGNPDIASFSLHSTLQGRLSGALDTLLEDSALALGVHGFYAVAVDDEGDTSVSDTAWVPVQAGVGLALLVAGTDFDDNRYYYENIAPNCNWAYSQLRHRGFTDSLITYFNPVGWQSIGGDYRKDSRIVDVTEMTLDNLRRRILGFKDRVRRGVPLLLSFIGHGGRADKQNGRFYLSPTEYLLPDSLDAWLDTYDRDGSGAAADTLRTPIVMVFDHCFAGAFFPRLRSATQNRVVIASSAADRQAYFQNGRSFSYALFRQIGKGGNLAEAWVAGRNWSDANTLPGLERANPLANADNDNTPNESEDFLRMDRIYVGGSQRIQGPEAAWKDVQLRYDEGSGSIRIQAFLEGRSQVDTAWYTMLAPDFGLPQAGAADPFIAGGLVRQEDGGYAGTVKLDPVLAGDYLFIVYGMKDGEELMPLSKRANPAPVGLARRAGVPARFDLGQNYPNPASGMTFIPLAVTRQGKAELTVRSLDGRLVRTLVSGSLAPGYYSLQWDGRDGRGRRMPPGIYAYMLTSVEGRKRRTLVWGR